MLPKSSWRRTSRFSATFGAEPPREAQGDPNQRSTSAQNQRTTEPTVLPPEGQSSIFASSGISVARLQENRAMEACAWRHSLFCPPPPLAPNAPLKAAVAPSAATRRVIRHRQFLRASLEFNNNLPRETQIQNEDEFQESSFEDEETSESEPFFFSSSFEGQTESQGSVEDDAASVSAGTPQPQHSVESMAQVPALAGSYTGSTSGVSGSGLLRSPTTGGVQSATSAHGLPDPAVAVRNLVAQSKHAHLCTVMSRMHHRRTGYPFASMVDFANDASGHPVFCLSSLAIHARNLLADPRCTLVVQIPGWSGLADARVTLFGEAYPVAPEFRDWASKVFAARHQQEASEQWGNSHFFRMETITDVYFVGGFGTVAWIDAREYLSVQPDRIASENSERTLKTLNTEVAGKLQESLMQQVHEGVPPVDSVSFIAVDSKGVDIRVQQGEHSHVRRLSFACARPVETVEEAQRAIDDMIMRGALPSGLVSQQA